MALNDDVKRWVERDEMLDGLERERLPWIEQHLPEYLHFHQCNGAHLPPNFVDRETGRILEFEDSRSQLLDRIGFFNYAIFVNLALADRSASSAPGEVGKLTDLWQVYDSVSSVYLRLGAAIDIARLLAAEVQSTAYRDGQTYSTGEKHSGKDLKNEIEEVDAYNNFLKHTGLVAVTLTHVAERDRFKVMVPRRAHPGMRTWINQKPEDGLQAAAAQATAECLAAFDRYFGRLTDAYETLHNRLAVVRKAPENCVGIVTIRCERPEADRYDGYGPPSEALEFFLPTSGSFNTTTSGVNYTVTSEE